MKTCPTFSAQCGTCNKFVHYVKCCTDMTRGKARDTNAKVKNVEEEGIQEARATHLSHAAISPMDEDNDDRYDPGNILMINSMFNNMKEVV